MRVRSRALLSLGFVALVGTPFAACAPARGGSNAGGPLATSMASGASSSIADAGAMRAPCMHDAKDLSTCVEDCDRAISFACTVLAGRLERGEGIPRDLPRAVVLHERACELRDAASCVSAARMHASGRGVPPSRAKQIELLTTACKLGDALSCAVPARAFATGNGVPRDERRATELWQTACAAGVAPACEAIEPAP